jgi:hypothetical protein
MIRQRQWWSVLAPIAALILLGGLTTERMLRATPEDARAYHQQVRVAIEAAPYELGPWSSVEIPIPKTAIQLLRPNAILSREYRHAETGQRVALLIVHCQDARDMAGHYPPICYPAHGWVADGEQLGPIALTPQTEPVLGTSYRFEMNFATHGSAMWIWNALLLPDGRTTSDMRVVRRAASDYLTHFFGAGQIQLIFDGEMTWEERERIILEFSPIIQPVLAAIFSGSAKQ